VELVLNLVWVASAATALLAWLRWRVEAGRDKSWRLIVLLLALAILFPVISITDDFWAAQNPAEADACQRRQNFTADSHVIVPATFALLTHSPIAVRLNYWRHAVETDSQSPAQQLAWGCLVFTRPPPSA